jgi:hypothetical protein
MVMNGGMEAFTGNIPTGWTSATPDEISRVTAQGRVHSGTSAVNMEDGGILTQNITGIQPLCYYEFSFFAHAEGARVGLTATVNFLTPGGDVVGGSITVRERDMPNANREFGYYRLYTIAAPADVTGVRIDFSVVAAGNQSVDIDDVSFGTQ